jgi:hypothetical protein
MYECLYVCAEEVHHNRPSKHLCLNVVPIQQVYARIYIYNIYIYTYRCLLYTGGCYKHIDTGGSEGCSASEAFRSRGSIIRHTFRRLKKRPQQPLRSPPSQSPYLRFSKAVVKHSSKAAVKQQERLKKKKRPQQPLRSPPHQSRST